MLINYRVGIKSKIFKIGSLIGMLRIPRYKKEHLNINIYVT